MQHGGFQVIFVSCHLLPVRDHVSLKSFVTKRDEIIKKFDEYFPLQTTLEYLKTRNIMLKTVQDVSKTSKKIIFSPVRMYFCFGQISWVE